jgi:thiol-disulfide isomerase/thioredoxin
VSTKARPAPKRPPAKPPAPARRWPLVGALLVAVAVVLLGAIIVTAVTNKSSTPPDVEQTRPVTIDGTPLPQLPDSDVDPATGMVAPVLKGASFDGKAQTIGGRTGKPTLVMFVAHWCPHCQAEVPRVVGWRADGTIPAGIDLVAVSTAASANYPNYPPSAWLERVKWPGRVMADDDQSSAATAYGLPVYPFFVALDKEGKVVDRGSGELDQASIQQLVREVQSA